MCAVALIDVLTLVLVQHVTTKEPRLDIHQFGCFVLLGGRR